MYRREPDSLQPRTRRDGHTRGFRGVFYGGRLISSSLSGENLEVTHGESRLPVIAFEKNEENFLG